MQLNSLTALIVCATLLAVLLLAAKAMTQKRKKQPLTALGDLDNIQAKPPLTQFERNMFVALRHALPDHIVLTQVAFSALITTTHKPTRNRFDRKVADFVVCDKSVTVIAIIELDDPSHRTKLAQDADRDAMLKKAGYTTIRYDKLPNSTKIADDIANLSRPTTAAM